MPSSASGAGTAAPPTAARRPARGEEARLTPGGPHAAMICSGAALPLRARSAARHHRRPEFPGTAVVLDEVTYEVVGETEDEYGVVYALDPWREGEVIRQRVVYDAGFLQQIARRRRETRLQARVRPWRPVLYPLVGLLPEEHQERLCERLGLYSVTATLVSGVCEASLLLLLLIHGMRSLGTGAALLGVLLSPGLILLTFPGLGRAFGAAFLRETSGTPYVVPLLRLLSSRPGDAWADRDGVERLTRRLFWARLKRPDDVQVLPDGGLVFRGSLPHLTWGRGRRVLAGSDYWQVEPLPPQRPQRQRALVYAYRLTPLTAAREGPQTLPAPTAYAEEVLAGVREEWNAWNGSGLSWLTTLLPEPVQARAFEHRGGPRAARRATLGSALAEIVLAAYLLSFLPGPPGDPVGPAVAVLAVVALLDGALRTHAALLGRYAPSRLRWLLPAHLLRGERVAYRAHQQAERDALGGV